MSLSFQTLVTVGPPSLDVQSITMLAHHRRPIFFNMVLAFCASYVPFMVLAYDKVTLPHN